MNTTSKKNIKIFAGAIAFCTFTTAGSAFSMTIDPTIFDSITEIISQKKQETMAELYPSKPLKDQMRGKMMIERSAANYMQDVIQPQMMGKNIERIKAEGIERIVNNDLILMTETDPR